MPEKFSFPWTIRSSNEPIPVVPDKKFLIAATNEDWARIGNGHNINNSLIIGATNGKSAFVGYAHKTISSSLIIGATNGVHAYVGHANYIQRSLIIGATNDAWTDVSNAYYIQNSLIIGATNKERAHVGFADNHIQNSLIIGATNGEGAHVGFADKNIQNSLIQNSLIIGATNGEGAHVGFADKNIQRSLIIGATNGVHAYVGVASRNIQRSLIIGATNGEGAHIGGADKNIENSLIIGATDGDGADVGVAFRNIENSLIIGATNGEGAHVGFADTIQSSLIIDVNKEEARVYNETGKMSRPSLPPNDMQMLKKIFKTLKSETSFLEKIRTKKAGKDRFVQKLKTDGNEIDLPEWYDKMVTHWRGATRPALNENFIDENVKPPAENLWTTKNIAFNGSELYIPDGTFNQYLQEVAMSRAISELLKIESVQKYVPVAVKARLNAQVKVDLGWEVRQG